MSDVAALAARGITRVECNTVEAVRNSANKLRILGLVKKQNW